MSTTDALLADHGAFIEVTTSGNSIRGGITDGTNDAVAQLWQDWDNTYRYKTGDQGYGIISNEVMGYYASANTFETSNINWAG